MELKKRREERIRELFRDPQRLNAKPLSGDGEQGKAWNAWREPPTKHQWMMKWAICAVLYVIVAGMYQWDHPATLRMRAFVNETMTVSFDFAKATEWYNRYIGDIPALLPAFDRSAKDQEGGIFSLPVTGAILSPYSSSSEGIWLATNHNQSVNAVGTGLVVNVTDNGTTGLTVVMRHADGMESIYGGLAHVSVKKSDWLERGAKIGIAGSKAEGGPGKLYFAMKQDNVFIDPGDVIRVD